MNSKMNVAVVREESAFSKLGPEWNELLSNSTSDTIFLRWEWLHTWWKVYGGGGKELFIITIRRDNLLLGIAPLYSSRHCLFFHKLQFLGTNLVCSDYLDFILRKEEEPEVIHELVRHLQQQQEEWDLLELTDLPSLSPQGNRLTTLFRQYPITQQKRYTICPYIDLTQSWQGINDSFSPLLQNNLKRKLKKLTQVTRPRFIQINKDENFREPFEQFLTINKLRLKEKNLNSPFLDTQFLSFHRQILEMFFPQGMASICFLQIDGINIAGIYQLTYNRRQHYYQSGFIPDWQQISPGTLLLHYCIKQAHDQGMVEFDFLQGDEGYKNNWTTQHRTNCKITIYSIHSHGYLAILGKIKDLLKSSRLIAWLRK